MRITKEKAIFVLGLVFCAFAARAAQAVCPVCTVAVGACIGLSRYLGVDDAITGLWIGGFIVSTTIWTINWLRGKNYVFSGYKILTTALYYLMIIVPLYFTGIIGHPFNKIWGIDKLVAGIILGSALFLLSAGANARLKKRNGGKVYFPFQKVVIPILALAIGSLIFYLLTC